MKQLKYLLLIASLLSLFFDNSSAQYSHPYSCTIYSPDVIIPWNRTSGNGVVNIVYSDYRTDYATGFGLCEVLIDNRPQSWIGLFPTQIYTNDLTPGIHTVLVFLSTAKPTGSSGCGQGSFFSGTINVVRQSIPAYISGPGALNKGNRGTYTANVTGGSGSFTYQWYEQNGPPGSGWVAGGTSQTETIGMLLWDINVRVEVHSSTYGSNGTAYFTISNGLSKQASGQAQNPTTFKISSFPNPFNPTTTITYQLPEAGYVMLKVFDVMGREVALLQDGMKEAGFYTTTFDASKLTSGLYFSRMIVQPQEGNPIVQTNKLILMK